MAIATEIGRLQGAKQDLISRLKAKGVTVPNDATLEEITPLVDNISGSGGSGGGSVDTCTLRIYSVDSACNLDFITYEAIINGTRRLNTIHVGQTLKEFNFEVSDAACDGLCIIVCYGDGDNSWMTSSNVAIEAEDGSWSCTFAFRLNVESGNSAYISFSGEG